MLPFPICKVILSIFRLCARPGVAPPCSSSGANVRALVPCPGSTPGALKTTPYISRPPGPGTCRCGLDGETAAPDALEYTPSFFCPCEWNIFIFVYLLLSISHQAGKRGFESRQRHQNPIPYFRIPPYICPRRKTGSAVLPSVPGAIPVADMPGAGAACTRDVFTTGHTSRLLGGWFDSDLRHHRRIDAIPLFSFLLSMTAWKDRRTAGKDRRHPGVAQLVERVLWEHEAVGSSPVARTICRCGGIGIHEGFRFPCWKRLAGSSPVTGTTHILWTLGDAGLLLLCRRA